MEETVAKLEEYLKNHETLRHFLEEVTSSPEDFLGAPLVETSLGGIDVPVGFGH